MWEDEELDVPQKADEAPRVSRPEAEAIKLKSGEEDKQEPCVM